MTDTLCADELKVIGYYPGRNRRINDPAQALREIADSMEYVADRDGVTVMSFRADPRLLDFIGAFTSPAAAMSAA